MAVSHGGGPAAGSGAVRKFPTGANYAEALQHPEVCFRDPGLKHGTVQQTPVLGPKAISGNFASVFSVTAPDGQRYALKCFTRDSTSLTRRYAAISSALGALSHTWSVGFEFLDEGVLVAGEWYPVVKMAWVQGTDLLTWLDRNRTDTAAVQALADRFLALVADLDKVGIAHGDLQHGNILVASDGTLHLVDYDGMYVPALKGEKATENGHRNYQSPSRTAADFGPAMDRFSAWVIQLSLLAVAADPGLWTQLHDPQGEFLILSEADFTEPAMSLAWPMLLGHPDERIRAVATRVRNLLGKPCSALPALTPDAVALPKQRSASGKGKGKATAWGTAKGGSRSAATAPPTTSGPLQQGVPAWMAGHIPAAAAGGTAAQAGPGPAGQPAPGFGRRRAGDLVVAASALLGNAAPGALALAAVQPYGYLPLTQGIALAVSGAAIGLGRRLRPECRDAKARVRELRLRARELKNPSTAHQRLEKDIRKLDESVAKNNAASDKRLQALTTELKDGQARITVDLNRSTGRIQKQLTELATKEARRIADALAPAVRTHIQERLRRTSIQEARKLTNMGDKMVRALMDAGIRTAADFTGVAFAQQGGAYLVGTSGQWIRVPGIGEARANTLESWRRGLEQRARATAPTKVPPPVMANIQIEMATLRNQLNDELKQIETGAQRSRDALKNRIADERQRLTAERQRRGVESQRQRAELIQRQKRLAGSEAELARVRTDLATARAETRRTLGTRRYVKLLATGR
ncbi:hypothetical protein [Streptomyces capitiformicae]|uniref:Protein kinase domain-containing protein n=1 Tax=Streptomyces capitiformicae TaxID=2014920 RepID=A0A918ZFC3_9ACTN|nr:hypothetical protein [Streptomyces capitiformicae]GHE49904.1 hypothetical protein GCM10017771_71480 [Streptomyces capitiformicae]